MNYDLRILVFFFFKQKTAYEMRISDWSSDVCSSDLHDSGTTKPQILIRQVDGQIQRREMMANAYAPLVACDRHRIAESSVMGRASQNFVYVRDKIGRASCRERVCQYV